MTDWTEPRRFTARLMNRDEATKMLDSGKNEGVAVLRAAVFGIPDTEIAVGNDAKQVIDRGAFAAWIASTDFSTNPVPMFLDHGDAMLHGYALAEKKIGYSDNFRETENGLEYMAHYNLRTQRGHDAFADLVHDPRGTQVSFRAPIGGEVIEMGEDDYEHVIRFPSVDEVSQVGFGAQHAAGLVGGVAVRAAISSHTTETSDSAWSGSSNKSNCPNTSGALRKAFAWVDSSGDATAKASYKFIHHFVSSDGSVGAASTRACSSGIAVLNGGRGGTVIPASDKTGVYRHLAKHLKDAGAENVAPLRRESPDEEGAVLGTAKVKIVTDISQLEHALAQLHGSEKPTEEEFRGWLEDGEFREAVTGWLGMANSPPASDPGNAPVGAISDATANTNVSANVITSSTTVPNGTQTITYPTTGSGASGDWVGSLAPARAAKPTVEDLQEWIEDEDFMRTLRTVIRTNKDFAEEILPHIEATLAENPLVLLFKGLAG